MNWKPIFVTLWAIAKSMIVILPAALILTMVVYGVFYSMADGNRAGMEYVLFLMCGIPLMGLLGWITHYMVKFNLEGTKPK